MPLLELSGKNVRNLKEYSISPSPHINIVSGKNGAGKTSILEGIYLNVLGRSFRTSTTRNLINDDEDSCWVFAQYKNTSQKTDRIGVERRKGNYQALSINGVHNQTLSQLANIAPTLAIQPSETQLIDGPSAHRRKHLDWVLFHVEPLFLDSWRNNQKLLKQRNMLLRGLSKSRLPAKSEILELKAWDKGYIKSSYALSRMREDISKRITACTQDYLLRLPAFSIEESGDAKCLDIGFYGGWPEEKELGACLESGIEQDIRKGFSRLGAHRCDLIIKSGGSFAKDHLSRGQKKLLAMSMCLAQAKTLQAESREKKSILLLDDIFSELDEENTKAFIREVEELDTQVFLTCLHTQGWIRDIFSREVRLFHVEQGQIKPLK